MKRVKFWVAALAAVLTVSAASAQSAEEVKSQFREAVSLNGSNRIADAIQAFEKVVTMGQACGADAANITSQAQMLLLRLYMKKGVQDMSAKQMDQAIEAFVKAQDLADRQGDVEITRKAGHMIANLYSQKGAKSLVAKDFSKALESFQKGLEYEPNNISLAYITASCYAETGQLEQAKVLYKQVIAAGAEDSAYADIAERAKRDMDSY